MFDANEPLRAGEQAFIAETFPKQKRHAREPRSFFEKPIIRRRLRKLLYNGFEQVLVFARHSGGSMQLTRWFRSLRFQSPRQGKPKTISVKLLSVTSFAKETRGAALLLFPAGRHSLSISNSARPRK